MSFPHFHTHSCASALAAAGAFAGAAGFSVWALAAGAAFAGAAAGLAADAAVLALEMTSLYLSWAACLAAALWASLAKFSACLAAFLWFLAAI